ncbi:tetratricopeptide repeat protein [Streptomyces sp. NPDC091279]|uniref:tetratricopeptide repeat protein n=1 Tax=Streptomyces sp. NPDC091279 TaxID=3365983 RepID=UPI003802BFF5
MPSPLPRDLESLLSAAIARLVPPDSPGWQELARVVDIAARADPSLARRWPPAPMDSPRDGHELLGLAAELAGLALRDADTGQAVADWARRHAPPEAAGPAPSSLVTQNVVGGGSVIQGPSVQARDIHGGVHFHLPAAPTESRRPAPCQLPPVTPRFVGREGDLRALDALRGERPPHAAQLLVVSGLAGIGKTSFVCRWLQEHAAEFPDGQLYADLGGHAADGEAGPVPPGTVLEGFLIALGAPAVPESTAQRSALWRSLTSRLRLAVLLDNAFSAAQTRPLLLGSPTGVTLVTSRNRLTGLRVEGASVHCLEGLAPEPAAALLALGGGTRIAREPAATDQVVRLCGRLPLALCLASAQLAARPHRSVADLAHSLSQGRAPLDTLRVDGEAVMRTALDTSYALLPREAAALYRRLGLLPTDRYDLHLVTALARPPEGAPEAAVVDVEVADVAVVVDVAVDALVEAHLLEETGPGTFRFHDLVRPHAERVGKNEETPADQERALRSFVDWCLAGAAGAERILTPSHRPPEPGAPELAVSVRPFDGPEAALGWLDSHRGGLMGALRECSRAGWDTRCWYLADRIWPLFLRFRPSALWIEAHRLGLDAARRAGSRAGEGRMLTSGAIGLRDAGRYTESADWYRQARELAVGDGDVRQQAQAVNGLGHLCLLTGELALARAHFEHALRLRESIGYRRGAALSRRRLGETALAEGDLEAASRYLRRAHADLTALEETYEAARVLALLGHVRDRAGDHTGGMADLEESLGRFRSGSARSQHWEARCLEWLGQAAETQGQRAQAVRYNEAALELFRQLNPADAERVAARLRQ